MGDPLGYGLGSLAFVASVGLSVVEGALSDFSWAKLEAVARAKKTDEKTATYLKKEDDLALAASSLKVAMNVTFVLMAARMAGAAASETVLTFITFGAMVGIILVADVPAYLVGRRLSESVLVKVLPAMNLVRFILQPALWASRFGGEVIARILGHPEVETQAESIAEEILSAAAEGRRDGVIAEEEEDMIEGIIRFKERETSDVMTPRTEMSTLPVDTSVNDAVKFALDKGFSRIPIFKETRDNIVGILHLRDLLEFWASDACEAPPLEKALREPHFTPETKKIPEIFEEMRARKTHMAVVVDEYGGTTGVITIEDILEEIVGEIEDEYDAEAAEPFRLMDDRTALVDGHFRIDDLNDRFEVTVPEEDGYDTIGGYLCSVFGRVPKRGEMHNLDSLEFTIMDANPRRVRLVQVIKDGQA